MGLDLEHPVAPLNDLADQLLLPSVPLGVRSGVHVGTRSRPGLQSFANGLGAVDRWDLAFADSALERATAYDSAFARARLWLAQVRVWRHRPRETWNFLVNRAAAARATLASRDQLALDALVAQGSGDERQACAMWERLAVQEATDFSAWYGAAMCQLQDDAVVRDARSPSGWSFRTSDQRAITMLRRAFEIFPVVHREFRTSWFAELDGLLMTTPTQLRIGFAQPPDTGMFMAYPSWSVRGDSLSFVPFRVRDVELGESRTLDASHHEAVRRQREIFLRTATTWRAAFPRSADALLAVAIALDKRGDRSALDSLRLARTLAVDDAERMRTGAATVWMLVKYGLPDDIAALRGARALADSLLAARRTTPPETVLALSSVAMLSGQVSLAVQLARAGSFQAADPTIASTVYQTASALQLLAAAGAPAESLRVLEDEVERGSSGPFHRRCRMGRAGACWGARPRWPFRYSGRRSLQRSPPRAKRSPRPARLHHGRQRRRRGAGARGAAGESSSPAPRGSEARDIAPRSLATSGFGRRHGWGGAHRRDVGGAALC